MLELKTIRDHSGPYETILFIIQIERMEKFGTIVEELNNYESILFHKNIVQCQRIAYGRNLCDIELMNGKLLIELDFKQKIVIGLSPRQINSEYYEQIVRSCLGNTCTTVVYIYCYARSFYFFEGFGVLYFENDEIKLINFDFISHDDSQTAESAVRAFRIMREQSWFERIDQKEYIVWTDCGKHFRNKTLVGYLLCELAKVHGIHGRPINFHNNLKSKLFQ